MPMSPCTVAEGIIWRIKSILLVSEIRTQSLVIGRIILSRGRGGIGKISNIVPSSEV